MKNNYTKLFSAVLIALIIYSYFSLYKSNLKRNKFYQKRIYFVEWEGAYLRNLENEYDFDTVKVFVRDKESPHKDNLRFYQMKYNIENNKIVALADKINELEINDSIFVCRKAEKEMLSKNIVADTIDTIEKCLFLKVTEIKKK
jgi:hypothetical protein